MQSIREEDLDEDFVDLTEDEPEFPEQRDHEAWAEAKRRPIHGGQHGQMMLLEKVTVESMIKALEESESGNVTKEDIKKYRTKPREALWGTGATLGAGSLAKQYVAAHRHDKTGEMKSFQNMLEYANPLDYSEPRGTKVPAAPFLKQFSKRKLELMLKMFDDGAGFGKKKFWKNPKKDRGFTSLKFVRDYIIDFCKDKEGKKYTEKSLEKFSYAELFDGILKPFLSHTYAILHQATEGSRIPSVAYVIRKFLAGDRTENVPGPVPPMEMRDMPGLSREREDAPHGGRLVNGIEMKSVTREPAARGVAEWRKGKKLVDAWQLPQGTQTVPSINQALKDIEDKEFSRVRGGTADIMRYAMENATHNRLEWIYLWAYKQKLSDAESDPRAYLAAHRDESDEKSSEVAKAGVAPRKIVLPSLRKLARRAAAPRRPRPGSARSPIDLTGQERAEKQAEASKARFGHYTRRTDLRVENAPTTAAIETSYNHLINGDLAPIGRVHLVSMGPLVGSEESRHFLAEMDADSNMGATELLNSSRRGPFKHRTGSSRIMDRSAHVTYRRRGHSLEITVIRGVTMYEMDTLIGKLGAHRVSTSNTHIFIVDGKRRKLGNIDRVDLEKLRTMIEDVLRKRRKVGILLTDTKEHGILHNKTGHARSMKAHMRQYRAGLE